MGLGYGYDPWGKRVFQVATGYGSDTGNNVYQTTVYFYGVAGQKLQTFHSALDGGGSYGRLLGTMLYELIHLSGFGGPTGPGQDTGLQAALGLKVNKNSTDNISKKLAKDCFKGVK
jgi:hypothetical protein